MKGESIRQSKFPQGKAIAGFRDTLIHGYFGVDLEILWDIIVHKIPVLQEEIASFSASQVMKIYAPGNDCPGDCSI